MWGVCKNSMQIFKINKWCKYLVILKKISHEATVRHKWIHSVLHNSSSKEQKSQMEQGRVEFHSELSLAIRFWKRNLLLSMSGPSMQKHLCGVIKTIKRTLLLELCLAVPPQRLSAARCNWRPCYRESSISESFAGVLNFIMLCF